MAHGSPRNTLKILTAKDAKEREGSEERRLTDFHRSTRIEMRGEIQKQKRFIRADPRRFAAQKVTLGLRAQDCSPYIDFVAEER